MSTWVPYCILKVYQLYQIIRPFQHRPLFIIHVCRVQVLWQKVVHYSITKYFDSCVCEEKGGNEVSLSISRLQEWYLMASHWFGMLADCAVKRWLRFPTWRRWNIYHDITKRWNQEHFNILYCLSAWGEMSFWKQSLHTRIPIIHLWGSSDRLRLITGISRKKS